MGLSQQYPNQFKLAFLILHPLTHHVLYKYFYKHPNPNQIIQNHLSQSYYLLQRLRLLSVFKMLAIYAYLTLLFLFVFILFASLGIHVLLKANEFM